MCGKCHLGGTDVKSVTLALLECEVVLGGEAVKRCLKQYQASKMTSLKTTAGMTQCVLIIGLNTRSILYTHNSREGGERLY